MFHADDLQAVSVDEALIDVSTAVNELREKANYSGDAAKDLAELIRDEVRKVTTCESKTDLVSLVQKSCLSYLLQSALASPTISSSHGSPQDALNPEDRITLHLTKSATSSPHSIFVTFMDSVGRRSRRRRRKLELLTLVNWPRRAKAS